MLPPVLVNRRIDDAKDRYRRDCIFTISVIAKSLNPEEAQILYIHGTGCNARVFERHINALTFLPGRRLRLCLGHGESGGAGYRGVVDHAHLVAEFMRRIGAVISGSWLATLSAVALRLLWRFTIQRAFARHDAYRHWRAPESRTRNVRKRKRNCRGTQRTPARILAVGSRTGHYVRRQLMRYGRSRIRKVLSVTLKDWYADDSCDFLTQSITDKPTVGRHLRPGRSVYAA